MKLTATFGVPQEIIDFMVYDRRAPIWTYKGEKYYNKEDLIRKFASYEEYYDLLNKGEIEVEIYDGIFWLPDDMAEEIEKNMKD